MQDAPQSCTLTGEFVDLRPLRVDDAQLTFAWRNSARATLLNQGARSAQEQARWIASRPAAEYNFIIETKNRHSIGMVSLTGIDPVNRIGEPGRFLIGDEPGAQGIPAAAEAMKLVYELAFERLSLRRVWGTVAGDNLRMIKWQNYMGMREEGRLRQHLFVDGRIQDAVVFGLLDSEYERVTRPRLDALIAVGRLRIQT
jgi:RimJ/RimL family protein N-acetyltransferase